MEITVVLRVIKRNIVAEGSSSYSRQRTYALDQLSMEGGDFLVSVVTRLWQRYQKCKNVVRIKTDGRLLGVAETFECQAGGREQKQRQGDLRDDQPRPGALPLNAVARSASSLMQS